MAFDYYTALTRLGSDIGAGIDTYNKQRMLSDIGTALNGGDYSKAAKVALAGGDLGSGLKLLEFGRQDALDAEARKALSGLDTGVSASPVAASVGGGSFGVSDDLWKRQIGMESGGRQMQGGAPLTSPKGAIGIAQVMPGTAPEAARLAGLPFDENRYRTDQSYNEALGRAYMGEQLRKFGGDKAKALAAYNAGPGAVQKAIERHGDNWLAHMPAETQQYVSRIGGGNTPVQVADASGAIPASAAPQPDRRAALVAERDRLSRIMPGSEQMQRAVKQRIDAIDFQLKEGDRESWSIIRPTDVGLPGDFKGIVKRNAKTGDVVLQRAGPETIMQGEKAYDQTLGKGYGETMLEMQKSGRSAPSAISSLSLLEKATNSPGFYSGSASDLVNAARKAAVSLGVADAGAAAPNEIFNKVANKLVLDLAGGSLGTGFSNADRDYLSSTVPSLTNTPEGNRQIIQIMKAVEQRKIEVAKLARDYAKANDGRIDAGFDDQLSAYVEKNPLFKSEAPKQQQGQLQTAPADLLSVARKQISNGADKKDVIEHMRRKGFDVPADF